MNGPVNIRGGEGGRFFLSYQGSLLVAFLGVFVPLCLFGWLAGAVSNHRSLGWEVAVLKSLPASTTPALDQISVVVAESGGINVVVVLAVFGVLALKRVGQAAGGPFCNAGGGGGGDPEPAGEVRCAEKSARVGRVSDCVL